MVKRAIKPIKRPSRMIVDISPSNFSVGQVNANGVPICGANDEGAPCQNIALLDNGRCKKHDKTNRYSKPLKYYEKFERAWADPDYLDGRETLHILDARISELMEQIGHLIPDDEKYEAEQKALWREARATIEERVKLSESQLKYEAYRDQHVSYAQVQAWMKRVQEINRELAFQHFGKKAIPFLSDLMNALRAEFVGE